MYPWVCSGCVQGVCAYVCVGGVVRGGDKGLGVPKSGSQHSLSSPSLREASGSKMWLRFNSEGISYTVLAMGKC